MTDIIRPSNFDRVLNIHQSVKLAQITDLNKAMLQTQLQQNQQLNALNRQLAETNNLNRQILENQISQIKRTEEQRFYKALVFNCIEIIEKIETVKNDMLQSYFVNIYKGKLKSNLENGKEILEELSDKTETKKQIEKLVNLVEINSIIFSNSPFAKLNDLISDYKNIETSFDKSLNNLLAQIKLTVIPGVGLFGWNKLANQNALNTLNEQKAKCLNLASEKKSQLDNHNLNDFLNQIEQTFPNFDELTNEVMGIENSFKNKFEIKPIVKEETPKATQPRPPSLREIEKGFRNFSKGKW